MSWVFGVLGVVMVCALVVVGEGDGGVVILLGVVRLHCEVGGL